MEVVPFAISENSSSHQLKIESVYTVTTNNEFSSKAIYHDQKGKFLQNNENDNIIKFLKTLNENFLDEGNIKQLEKIWTSILKKKIHLYPPT